MSLATRCTSCGTVFRVVQDQLKVSEGWVRCGRCQEVFNAVEGLFDLDREPPPVWPQATDRPAAEPASPLRRAAAEPGPPAAAAPPRAGDDRPLLPTEDSVLPEDFADAQFPSELNDEDDDTATVRVSRAGLAGRDDDDDDDEEADRVPSAARAPAPVDEPEPEPSPEFLRMAEHARRWEQPRARATLALGVVGLGLLLALQLATHLRDTAAARWPALRPVLNGWCTVIGCAVEAPRALESLAVDSSGLVKLEPEGLYRLEIVLRNRGSHDVRVPSIDLSLTDPLGRLVARRMMPPDVFEAPRAAIGAGGELPMNVVLSTGDARVAGYTIDLFYP